MRNCKGEPELRRCTLEERVKQASLKSNVAAESRAMTQLCQKESCVQRHSSSFSKYYEILIPLVSAGLGRTTGALKKYNVFLEDFANQSRLDQEFAIGLRQKQLEKSEKRLDKTSTAEDRRHFTRGQISLVKRPERSRRGEERQRPASNGARPGWTVVPS